MNIQKFPLSDEQSVNVHTRPTFKQMRALNTARRELAEDEVVIEMLLIFCTEWEIKGEDGTMLPLSKEGIDACPWDVLQEVGELVSEKALEGALPPHEAQVFWLDEEGDAIGRLQGRHLDCVVSDRLPST